MEIFAKTTVDLILSFEVPARRLKKDQPESGDVPSEVEMTIWLKDFPTNMNEFRALYALKQGIHSLYIIEEKFIPEEQDDYTIQTSLNQNPSFL